uniref:U11/U12 small nuclear ribonucleoprotein 48 kDa protein-like n=1 Tax=Styela clava TaxID=7725 RepID=UPI001939A9CD|nr:U11/U12 small nuclear ribonucleoprotein 48 kDa protein-like [Styela clava]
MDAGIEAYLNDVAKDLSTFESAIGWKSQTDEQTSTVVCPCDEGHQMPAKCLDRHLKSCKWRNLGYTKEEIVEIHEQEERTKIEINRALINSDDIISRVVPGIGPIRTDERYKSLLNSDQRRAVYDAAVAQCYSGEKIMPDKALYADLEAKAAEKLYQKENPDNLSETELLQKMRDMKKRRQSYRAKNVHITKRSQTEIIRGVLAVHMEELTKLWNPKKSSESTSGTPINESHISSQQVQKNEQTHAHATMDYNGQQSQGGAREQMRKSYEPKQSRSRDFNRKDYEEDKHHRKRRKRDKSKDRTYKRQRR